MPWAGCVACGWIVRCFAGGKAGLLQAVAQLQMLYYMLLSMWHTPDPTAAGLQRQVLWGRGGAPTYSAASCPSWGRLC